MLVAQKYLTPIINNLIAALLQIINAKTIKRKKAPIYIEALISYILSLL